MNESSGGAGGRGAGRGEEPEPGGELGGVTGL